MTSPARARGPLFLAAGVILLGWLVYLGVSATSRDVQPEHDPARTELAFSAWNPSTWREAASRPALVLLLVSDSLSTHALELERILADEPIAATLASRFLPVRIDRRDRPDLVERYAEEQVPHLSVLLPTGEALSRISGSPDTWTQQLVETSRYWHDHQEELRDRAQAFWKHREEDTAFLAPTSPSASDLELVDSAVFEWMEGLFSAERPEALWRTDLDRYLSARTHPRAAMLFAQLKRAREERRAELESPSTLSATPAQWLRTVLELRRFGGLDFSSAQEQAVKATWDRLRGPRTADEAALDFQLSLVIHGAAEPAYPGLWLGLDSGSVNSLPHGPDQSDLDGYLPDALAWLEALLETGDIHGRRAAVRLADSLWGNLWDPRRSALRDKPVRPGYLQEIDVFPRAQLGRAAALFDQLAVLSGESRFARRADSCLAGFAPYVPRAGSAATYFGATLQRRLGAS